MNTFFSFHTGAAACLLALGLTGCAPRGKNSPPPEQVRDAVSAALPPYLILADNEAEPISTGPDTAKTNFKASVSPKEDLFVVDHRVEGDPPFLLVKLVQATSSKTTIYGSVLAQRTVDRWSLDAPVFTDDLQRFGSPLASFGPRSYAVGSPEAAQALQALSAHNDELERQRKEKEEKDRQARQAEADQKQRAEQAAKDQKQRQEQAAKDKLFRATAPGTRYLGTLTDPSSTASQRLRLTFTEQTGNLLRAEVSTPDKPAEHRSLSGELVFAPQLDNNFLANKAYPIRLSAANGKQGPSSLLGRFFQQNGPLGLIPTEEGGLEGEAVIFQRYIIHLQRVP